MVSKVLRILALILSLAVPAAADGEVFTSGDDWVKRMSTREKLIALLPPSLLMQRFGVHLERTPQDYIPLLDRVIEYNPQLRGEDVANIFPSAVYRTEPANRVSLEHMERYLRRRRDYESRPIIPRLRLSPIAERDVRTTAADEDAPVIF